MNAEVLKGHLDLLLLAAVQARPAHGYAIALALRTRSADALDLSEGTLYPALHRLERAGLLASRWADANGRRRRVYQLTRKGARALTRQHAEWRSFVRTVDAIVEGC
jgi:PadR family transcriptional regulator, regulatory protein PadR